MQVHEPELALLWLFGYSHKNIPHFQMEMDKTVLHKL